MVKLGQELVLKQDMRLGALQLQVIRMLSIPTMELEQRVKEELERNPTLEEGPEAQAEESQEGDAGDEGYEQDARQEDEEFSVDDYLPDDEEWEDRQYSGAQQETEAREERGVASMDGFREGLVQQLRFRRVEEQLRLVAEYIVWNLEDDGYLRVDLEDLRDQMYLVEGQDYNLEEWEDALRLVQSLEPRGVGARSLRECLLLQLRGQDGEVAGTARRVLEECYEDFTKRNYARMEERLALREPQLREALELIATLHPRAEGIGGGETDLGQVIVPDFLLRVDSPTGEMVLVLNGRNMPELHVSRHYQNMLKDLSAKRRSQKGMSDEEQETAAFVRRNIDIAKGFIESLRMRNLTLVAVMEAIIGFQEDYFVDGDRSLLRPMLMKDIADVTGLDISTVSRVANSKYIQTPWGIVPLRQLFMKEVLTQEGESVTAGEAKRVLQEIVAGEDRQKPYSDEELVVRLEGAGYSFSRRTIAKYRKELGIPTARMRRQL